MHTVQVLLSSYNGSRYIRDQIDSILRQRGVDVRLWVRDDGSADGTPALLRALRDQGQLRLTEGENLGAAHSFLRLLEECGEAEYVAFADQDDVWHEDKLQSAVRALMGIQGPALYCANAYVTDEGLKRTGRPVNRRPVRTDLPTLSCAGGLMGCTMVMNGALAQMLQKQAGETRVRGHDFYAALVCAAMGGTLIYDDAPVMEYRQHGDNAVGVPVGLRGTLKNRVTNVTQRRAVTIADQARTVLERYGDDMPPENRAWLARVARYPDSLSGRALLAFSPKTRYMSWNMGLKIRLSILLGRR